MDVESKSNWNECMQALAYHGVMTTVSLPAAGPPFAIAQEPALKSEHSTKLHTKNLHCNMDPSGTDQQTQKEAFVREEN